MCCLLIVVCCVAYGVRCNCWFVVWRLFVVWSCRVVLLVVVCCSLMVVGWLLFADCCCMLRVV